MSIRATNWVWGLNDLPNAAVKLVLMKYADHAHDDGTHTWQSIEKVATYALCSVRSAQRHVAWLIEHGYMREGDQSVIPSTYDPRHRPIAYELAMSEGRRAEWEALNAAGANGRREAAKAAGTRGGLTSAQVRRGDNLAPLKVASTASDSRGDKMAPPGGDKMAPLEGLRGDTADDSGVTNETPRGDTGVTQTTQEPSIEPSPDSSLRSESAAEPLPGTGEQQPDPNRMRGKALTAKAQEVTEAWWEWIEAEGHEKPAQSFVACRGVVKAAIGNGLPDRDIRKALAVLTQEGRAVSGGTLQTALRQVRGEPDRRGLRRGYDDVATWGEYDPNQQPEPESEEELERIFGPPRTGTNG